MRLAQLSVAGDQIFTGLCEWLLHPGIPLYFSLLNLTSPQNTRLKGRSSLAIMLGVISGFGNPLHAGGHFSPSQSQ